MSNVQVPKFYDAVPPAPEGLLWWKYAPGVPPLPTVASVLGASFSSYQWRYDPNFKPNSFEFTNLDRVGAYRGNTGLQSLTTASCLGTACS
jgi:hypothetical protein